MRPYFMALILACQMAAAQPHLKPSPPREAPAEETDTSWYRFSRDGRECIVSNPDLPTPWLNRLSNDVFSTWITHNGYIESYLLDPVWNGLTNPQHTSGHFYIRDKATGFSFEVNRPLDRDKAGAEGDSRDSSPLGTMRSGPAKDDPWECHVGLGYNRITHTADSLQAAVTYFVPRNGDDVLLMIATVRNLSVHGRDIDLFGQVEWNLGDETKSFILRGDGRGGSQFNLYKKVRMQDNVLLATQRTWRSTGSCRAWPYTGFFTVSEPITSYETIRATFIGTGRDDRHPLAVEKGICSNTGFWSEAEYPWGVLHNTLSLSAGGERTLVYVLGMCRDQHDIAPLAEKYRDPAMARQALAALAADYDTLAGAVQVETPDKDNDRIINTWTPYMWRQFWKKSLNDGAFSMGLWSYGIEGETMGINPEQVLLPFDMRLIGSAVADMLRHQVDDTTQTDLYEPGHSLLYADLRSGRSDPHPRGRFSVLHHHQMWGFFYSLYYYLLETGDLSFLDRSFPYIDGREATVWQHLCTAMTILAKGIDERGFPRIPRDVGDWMDEFTKISSHDHAESEMMAGEECFILKGFADIAGRVRHPEAAREWMTLYDRMKTAVNTLAWDGQWYIRAFSDRGDPFLPVGSHVNAEGKIYLNGQSWPIISGIAPPDRAAQSLAAVKKYLMSDYGPMIFSPSYSTFVDDIGTQSIYAPGFRNACIYLRPVGWAIIAACLDRQPALAYEMYQSASLKSRAQHIDQLMSEPYAYPENYDGPDHRLRGRGEFQWNLGEGAAWMWQSYVGYILGVRPALDGLLIDPQIPASWDGYKVRRTFRGEVYEIEVRNPRHVSNGVATLIVDGKRIHGQLIPAPGRPGAGEESSLPGIAPAPATVHKITVIM